MPHAIFKITYGLEPIDRPLMLRESRSEQARLLNITYRFRRGLSTSANFVCGIVHAARDLNRELKQCNLLMIRNKIPYDLCLHIKTFFTTTSTVEIRSILHPINRPYTSCTRYVHHLSRRFDRHIPELLEVAHSCDTSLTRNIYNATTDFFRNEVITDLFRNQIIDHGVYDAMDFDHWIGTSL